MSMPPETQDTLGIEEESNKNSLPYPEDTVLPKHLDQPDLEVAGEANKETQPQNYENNDQNTVSYRPPEISNIDLDRMKDKLFFLFPDYKQRLSKFWLLLSLAAIIAASGVVNDSSATVIGAMIVAPLMTPILGLMLSIVVMDQKNGLCCFSLVISGVALCFIVGLLYGYTAGPDTVAPENNSQVKGRVEPKIPDLIAAIATGVVGSVALVRNDIGDTLPGVSISISLVPPICVAGMMLSINRTGDAGGAMLLFATNLMSILVVGIFVMYLYNVHLLARRPRARSRRLIILSLIVCFCLIAAPLGYTSWLISKTSSAESCVRQVIDDWAATYGWKTSFVRATSDANDGASFSAYAAIAGPPPFPEDYVPLSYANITEACSNIDSVEITFYPRVSIEANASEDEAAVEVVLQDEEFGPEDVEPEGFDDL